LAPPNTHTHTHTPQQWRELERSILSQKIPIPVYLSLEEETLGVIHDSLASSAAREKHSTVTASLWHILTGYGYQMISEDQKEAEVVKDSHVVTLVGKLAGGLGVQQRLPTVMVVAHYDAFGAAPSLSSGVDSNASGVAALLGLARLFSRLYRDVKQKPRSNLLFVLSGGGKLNYFGTKSLLEEDNDDLDSLIHSSDYIICLDSLAATAASQSHDQSHDPPHSLTVHVSKPPKEGSKAAVMLDLLNRSFSQLSSGPLRMVHKKIRLSDDLLSWEHERFSLKRLPAATISALCHHGDPRRQSMFVNSDHIDVEGLTQNVAALADGLARYLYNLSSLLGTEGEREGGERMATLPTVSSEYVSAWLDYLASHSRSPQLLTEDHPLVTGLYQAMSQSLQDVTKLVQRPEKSDPEFVLYHIPQTTLHAHKVKSPIFDLFVAVGVALYLCLWYSLIEFFPWSAVGFIPLPLKVKSSKS
ncbi:Nicalin-1, partial [Geodia barretti]